MERSDREASSSPGHRPFAPPPKGCTPFGSKESSPTLNDFIRDPAPEDVIYDDFQWDTFNEDEETDYPTKDKRYAALNDWKKELDEALVGAGWHWSAPGTKFLVQLSSSKMSRGLTQKEIKANPEAVSAGRLKDIKELYELGRLKRYTFDTSTRISLMHVG